MNNLVCDKCGETFENKGLYDRHLAGPHTAPAPELTAAELEKGLRVVEFPISKADLVAFASRQAPMEMAIQKALEGLPDREYKSAADVAAAFKATTTAQQKDPPAQRAH